MQLGPSGNGSTGDLIPMPKLNSTMRAVYSDSEKRDTPIKGIPLKRRSKPTMKIDMKAKLDLEDYMHRHHLRTLGQAVAHMQRRLQE